MKQRLLASLCLISLMLYAYYQPFGALKKEPKLTTLSGEAMTLDYHITFGQSLNQEQRLIAEREILITFEEIYQTYNQWNPHSLISTFNKSQANQQLEVPPLLEKLLLTANHIYQLSNGYYDLSIEPLKTLWITALKNEHEPKAAEIAEIAPQIGWHQVHIEDGSIWKEHDQLALNLDSIAKGLCVDLLTERLIAQGFSNLLVEWGGEVRAVGQHPDKRPWQLFIRYLEDTNPSNALATVSLNNNALATSGDYLQHWTVHPSKENATTYFHVLDPHTLRPLSIRKGSIASVTVRAPTCALADALATAGMFCENLEEAKLWARHVQESYPDTSFWFAARK